MLHIINKLGVKAGVGYAYEFAGPAINALSMEERMTICNMSIEGGARCGYINPDEKTFSYIKNKLYAPKNEHWDKALRWWKSLKSDENSIYDDVIKGLFIRINVTASRTTFYRHIANGHPFFH